MTNEEQGIIDSINNGTYIVKPKHIKELIGSYFVINDNLQTVIEVEIQEDVFGKTIVSLIMGKG